MPTYEYACTSCGEHLEVVQSFRDEPLEVCPACAGPLRKVFGSIGVVFKGSGFYKTDSRSSSSSSKRAESSDGKSESKSDGKSESSKDTSTSTKSTESSGSGSSGGGDKKDKSKPSSSTAAAS